MRYAAHRVGGRNRVPSGLAKWWVSPTRCYGEAASWTRWWWWLHNRMRLIRSVKPVARMGPVDDVVVASGPARSPFSGIRHRFQGSLRRQRLAFLQQFDRMPVGGADEGHLAVARRPVDDDASLHQTLAKRIDIVDLIGEMTEIACFSVVLRIPVVG